MCFSRLHCCRRRMAELAVAVAAWLAMTLPMQAADIGPGLVFACDARNDLYRVMIANGQSCPRFASYAEAVGGARAGFRRVDPRRWLPATDDAHDARSIRSGRGQAFAVVRGVSLVAAGNQAGRRAADGAGAGGGRFRGVRPDAAAAPPAGHSRLPFRRGRGTSTPSRGGKSGGFRHGRLWPGRCEDVSAAVRASQVSGASFRPPS